MEYLRNAARVAQQISSAVGGAGGIPNLPQYTLGDRDEAYDRADTIWTHYTGIKKDDQSPVSVWHFDSNPQTSTSRDRRSLIVLAKNYLRKVKTLRHPDILKYLDGSETETSVWIVTESVTPLTNRIGIDGDVLRAGKAGEGLGEEWRVWGISKIVSALTFLNVQGTSTHGNLRPSSILISQGGEWRLGGLEVTSSMKDQNAVLFTYGGLLPDAGRYASPEVRTGGWSVLRDHDPSTLDSYQLHSLIHILFNGPPPLPGSSSNRGSIPVSIFPAYKRLGLPSPQGRMKVETFGDLGGSTSGLEGVGANGGGFFKTNRLIVLCDGLEGFALASERERDALLKAIKGASGSLPPEFLAYKVLPSLAKVFEYGPGGPPLLPLIIQLGSSLPPQAYNTTVLTPLVRVFASSDRAMRMALLDNLEHFKDRLDNKTVQEKIWPNIITGFSDSVPIIREATVKSILMIAPKLSDRTLNNDLLRYLAKTQNDPEPGIRTNTCILLGRLSKHLSPATNRKVLVPAFARAVRDPFVHARVAGLMALMATAENYEKEDLAGRVIPAMSICLIDKEKKVRDQAFRAIDMFVKRTENLTASMPDTILPDPAQQQSPGLGLAANDAAGQTQPGIAMSAAGAAGALAGWAFTSASKKLAASDLQSDMSSEGPGRSTAASNGTNGPAAAVPRPGTLSPSVSGTSTPTSITTPTTPSIAFPENSLPGGIDWGANGGDLIDVGADADDWAAFESAPAPYADPIGARLSTKPVTKNKPSTTRQPPQQKRPTPAPASSLKLNSVPKKPISLAATADAGDPDAWDIEDSISDVVGDEWENEFDNDLEPSTSSPPPSKPASPPPSLHRPLSSPRNTSATSVSLSSTPSTPRGLASRGGTPRVVSSPSLKAPTASLGDTDGWGSFDDGDGGDGDNASESKPPPSSSGGALDKKAEMERMRAERKKRLEEAKKKKGAAVGVK